MKKRLFISNLDFEYSNSELFDLFSKSGGCLGATIALDRETKKSKGFGFIEMESEEASQKAIAELNGFLINGRPLKVVEDRGRTGGGSGGESNSFNDGDGGNRTREFLPPIQRTPLFKRRKRLDPFAEDPSRPVNYNDVAIISKYLSERGKILSRRLTGLTAYNQRKVSKAIKRAQNLGLMPFSRVGKGSY